MDDGAECSWTANEHAIRHCYLYRHMTPALDQAQADTPVVCLLGPRQCGKSTLARQSQNYFELARQDPDGCLKGLLNPVTIDESPARAPELPLAIKRSVDRGAMAASAQHAEGLFSA